MRDWPQGSARHRSAARIGEMDKAWVFRHEKTDRKPESPQHFGIRCAVTEKVE
jgi:hypothetical protein